MVWGRLGPICTGADASSNSDFGLLDLRHPLLLVWSELGVLPLDRNNPGFFKGVSLRGGGKTRAAQPSRQFKAKNGESFYGEIAELKKRKSEAQPPRHFKVKRVSDPW